MSLDTGSLLDRAHVLTTGIIMATSGVLLRNADMNPTGIIMRNWASQSRCGLPRTCLMNRSRALLTSTALATTKSTATVSTPSLAKPESAVSIGMMSSSIISVIATTRT